MKKHIIAFSLLALTTQHYTASYAAGRTKPDIVKVLVGAHNGAFGKDNLYAQQISTEELQQWDQAMRAAKDFVEINSKNTFGIKDSNLMSALSTIEKANIDLINTIKTTRATANSPSMTKQYIDVFGRIEQAMISIQNNLKNATFYLNKAEKTLARDILNSMALSIELTATKAIKDTAKL